MTSNFADDAAGNSQIGLAKRMSFLGVIAWMSVCLIVAGMCPSLGSRLSLFWTFSGLLGLVSAVGLAQVVKSEMLVHQRLLDSYIVEARTDSLTGVANRRALDFELSRAIRMVPRRPLSLLLIDVDHFKEFNDSHGHQAGDETLRSVAATLCETVCNRGIVCRYGGEEFAVVLPAMTLAETNPLAERLRRAVANQRCTFRGTELQVTVSVGVAEAEFQEDANSLLQRADAALYAAKQAGRDLSYAHDGLTFQPITAAETREELAVAILV